MWNKLFTNRQTTNSNGTATWTPRNGGSLIELRSVEKAYDTAAGEFLALKGVNLTVDPGEFVAVVGKSGSGKSTLINMITGIDRPTEGEVLVAGTPVHTLKEGQMASWRGRNIGIVFQFFQLLPTLTVLENVMLPMDFCNVLRSQGTPRAGHDSAGTGRHGRPRRQAAFRAVRRPAAAGGHRPCPGQRPAHHRRRRADRQPGFQDGRRGLQPLRRAWSPSGKTILMVTHDDDLAHRVTRTVTIADGAIVGDERTTPAWQQNGVAAAAVHNNGKVETPLIPVPTLSVSNPEVSYA